MHDAGGMGLGQSVGHLSRQPARRTFSATSRPRRSSRARYT